MSKPEKEKRIPRKGSVPVSKDDQHRDQAGHEEPSDSGDVERAVYDGMQDLRVKKPG